LRSKKHLIDSNVYIGAVRDTKKAEELYQFSSAFSPFLYMSSVVAKELLVGADPNKQARKRVEAALILPFERIGRIITPSHQAWKRAAEVIARLNRHLDSNGDPIRSSFWNDALIAASCAEHGITVITSNTDDFERIRRVLAFSYCPPFPGLRH
jgi:predicted nucleic acid-binding protein